MYAYIYTLTYTLWKLIKSQQDINPSFDLQIITTHKFTKSFSVLYYIGTYGIIFNMSEVYIIIYIGIQVVIYCLNCVF